MLFIVVVYLVPLFILAIDHATLDHATDFFFDGRFFFFGNGRGQRYYKPR